jgi:hypothetical protein
MKADRPALRPARFKSDTVTYSPSFQLVPVPNLGPVMSSLHFSFLLSAFPFPTPPEPYATRARAHP